MREGQGGNIDCHAVAGDGMATAGSDKEPGQPPVQASVRHSFQSCPQSSFSGMPANDIPMLATTMAGRVTGFNKAARALLGGPGRLYDRDIRDLLPFVPDPLELTPATVIEGRIRDLTGQVIDVQVTRTVVANHVDDQDVLIYVIKNISARV